MKNRVSLSLARALRRSTGLLLVLSVACGGGQGTSPRHAASTGITVDEDNVSASLRRFYALSLDDPERASLRGSLVAYFAERAEERADDEDY